jgi:hypothetical protein
MITMLGLLLSTVIYAKGIKVEWSCPANSSVTSINVFYDEEGKITFAPDVFKDKSKIGALDECVKRFQDQINDSIINFKNHNCPLSKDQFCFASLEYSHSKVFQKIKTSDLLKSNPSVSIVPFAKKSPSSVPLSAEDVLESKILRKEINPKDLSQTFEHDGKQHKVSDFDQVIGENIENTFMNMSKDEAKQYAQNYMLAKSDILNSENSSTEKALVIGNLEKMFGYIHGDKYKEELSKAIECVPESHSSGSIEAIVAKIEETDKVENCQPLNAGQHKVFKKDQSQHYSTGNYTLKRRQDGNFQAILNVNFVQASGSVSPQELMNRSKRCLGQASNAMKGPDGEMIEMILLGPDEISKLPSDERPGVNNVKIEGPNFGTNDGAYAETVDCATITHEMLHLMGLCDEYEETRPEYAKYGWKCRVITKAPSIMRELSTYKKAIGGTLSCNCTSMACSSIMNSASESVRKIYASQTFYEISGYDFRTKYCKEEFLKPDLQDIPRTASLIKEDSNSFVIESRYVSPFNSSPHFRLFRTKVTCNCPERDELCNSEREKVLKEALMDRPRRNCPLEAPYVKSDTFASKIGGHLDGTILKIGVTPEIPSLIQPNHFYKILEGNCPGKAAGYRECADFAYKGEPCNIPEKCKDDSYYLGTKQ